MRFSKILISFTFIIAGAFSIEAVAKVKKPKYANYAFEAQSNLNWMSLSYMADQQTYRIFMISPNLRKIAYEHITERIEQNTEKQSQKLADNPIKLTKELEEDQYEKVQIASWDHSNLLELAVVPVQRASYTKYGT